MLNVLDGDVLKDLVRTLLATVKAQAETIDSINARCAAIEKLNPEEIVTRVTDLGNGLRGQGRRWRRRRRRWRWRRRRWW